MRKISTKSSVISIGMDDFNALLTDAAAPIVLACIHRDYKFAEQLASFGSFSELIGDRVHTCLLDMICFPIFSERFKILGSPAFLMFIQGREIDRLLGRKCGDTLLEWVCGILSAPSD